MAGYDYLYYFTRESGDTIHSDPDCYNIGHRGEPTGLYDRLKGVFPSKDFKMKLTGTTGIVGFTTELTSEEESELGNTISSHKSVEDWPLDENFYEGLANRVCQSILTQATALTDESWQLLGSLTWMAQRYRTFSEGFFLFTVYRGNRDMQIRLRDIDHNENLASNIISSSGLTSKCIKIDKPSGNCRLVLQARIGSGDDQPQNNIAYNALIEWE